MTPGKRFLAALVTLSCVAALLTLAWVARALPSLVPSLRPARPASLAPARPLAIAPVAAAVTPMVAPTVTSTVAPSVTSTVALTGTPTVTPTGTPKLMPTVTPTEKLTPTPSLSSSVTASAALPGSSAVAPVAIAALGFTPPAAGSYQLERIQQVPDGEVLDSDGSAHPLRAFTRGRLTLFSFIYTYCTDARGCPLAYATLHALRDVIAHDPALRGKVRFVSMSFDPAFDTPAMMRSYAGSDGSTGSTGSDGSISTAGSTGSARRGASPTPWHFLTTASTAQLAPLLDGFGQDLSVIAPAPPGQRAPVLSHLLKVYLIDADGMVREIYSTAYLHPQILRNDLLTLLLEENRRTHGRSVPR